MYRAQDGAKSWDSHGVVALGGSPDEAFAYSCLTHLSLPTTDDAASEQRQQQRQRQKWQQARGHRNAVAAGSSSGGGSGAGMERYRVHHDEERGQKEQALVVGLIFETASSEGCDGVSCQLRFKNVSLP